MSTHEPIRIGVIGGSGIYQMEGMTVLDEVHIDTPFGKPSDAIIIGELDTDSGKRRVAFLPRHGRGHAINPTQIPARANIWALKKLGVFWLTSVSAVGSLKLEIEPCHFVVPDQIIDRTRSRVNTFFDDIAVHCGFSYPFHPDLRKLLLDAARTEGVPVHDGGTYVCMEGPLFSTIAESNMHRAWGASIIGMTALPEAKLAREAEMCYACLALATDYDVWHEDDHVSIDQVMANLKKNSENAQRTVRRVISSIPLGAEEQSEAFHALKYAIMTRPDAIPASTRRDLAILLDKYLP
jgi:5'-methylthioadenosine phosphorylase